MQSLSNFLAPGLLSRLSTSTRLTRLISDVLPEHLAHHTECSGIAGGSLNLVADSAAHSNQLRFYADELLERLTNEGFEGVTRVTVKTGAPRPAAGARSRSSMSPEPLSPDTRKLLESTARSTDNPRLRDALNKLARMKEE